MTVQPLILNIALLVALSVVQQFILRRWRQELPVRQVISGALFGLVAIVVMRTPLTLAPGVIFDGRSIILGIAGLFGGTVAATIAALMAAAYRLYLGGVGATMGIAVIAESALLGLIFRHAAKRRPALMRSLPLWLLGIAIHVIMILLLGLLPGGLVEEAVRRIMLPVLVLYPLGFLLVAQLMIDQQQRMDNEEALKRSEERHRAIVHSAPFGMYVYRLDGHELIFETANPAADAMIGISHTDFVGKRIEEAFPMLDRDGMPDLYRRLARDGGAWRTESYNYDDGTVSGTFEITAFNAGKDTVAVAFTEVSEKIQKAEELRRYREELEAIVAERTQELESANRKLRVASEAKTRFLRAMSHELRTPLNSIIGFSDILRKGMAGPINEEQSRQVEMVNSSGRHLLALINDVLDLSRIEADRLELHVTRFDAAEVARDVVETLRPEAAAKDLGLTVDTEKIIMTSDRLKVRQILLNLLGNALKFTEQGSVHVAVSRHGDDSVAFSVADSGPGIAPERQEAVFGEFVQAEEDEGPRRGTGLGLAISRGLASALGGTLTVESVPGTGSTFILTLPVIRLMDDMSTTLGGRQ